MHQYEKRHSAFPELLPSTYKAILVHTAKDLEEPGDRVNSPTFPNPDTSKRVRFHRGPDFATGWGRVDAEKARLLVEKGKRWKEDAIEARDVSDRYCVEVPANSVELKATLAWDDFPGDTSSPQIVSRLVNDLDLFLLAPDGSKVFPWRIDPLPGLTESPTNGIEEQFDESDIAPAYASEEGDHLNNVEMATKSQPAAGTWHITVSGYRLPMGTPQRYSLVATYPILEECP
jgi:hypothetical protein